MRASRTVLRLEHCDLVRLRLGTSPVESKVPVPRTSRLAMGGLLRMLSDAGAGAASEERHVCVLDPFDDMSATMLDQCARKTMPANLSVHLFNRRTRTLHLAAGTYVPPDSRTTVRTCDGGIADALMRSGSGENPYLASARAVASAGLGPDVVVLAFVPSVKGLPTLYTQAGITHFLGQLRDSGVTHVMFASSAWGEWTEGIHSLWVIMDKKDVEGNPIGEKGVLCTKDCRYPRVEGLSFVECLGGPKNQRITGAFAENMFGLPVPPPIARTYTMCVVPENPETTRILAVTCEGDVKTARIDAAGRAQITYDVHDHDPFQGAVSLVVVGSGDVDVRGDMTIVDDPDEVRPSALTRFPVDEFAHIIATGLSGDVPTPPHPETVNDDDIPDLISRLETFYGHPWVQRARATLAVRKHHALLRKAATPLGDLSFRNLFHQLQTQLAGMVECPTPVSTSMLMREASAPIPGTYGC